MHSVQLWTCPAFVSALAVRWFASRFLLKVAKLQEAKKRYKDTTGTDYAPQKPNKKKEDGKKPKPNVSERYLYTKTWSRRETS